MRQMLQGGYGLASFILACICSVVIIWGAVQYSLVLGCGCICHGSVFCCGTGFIAAVVPLVLEAFTLIDKVDLLGNVDGAPPHARERAGHQYDVHGLIGLKA